MGNKRNSYGSLEAATSPISAVDEITHPVRYPTSERFKGHVRHQRYPSLWRQNKNA